MTLYKHFMTKTALLLSMLFCSLFGLETNLVIDTYENTSRVVNAELKKGTDSIRVITAHFYDTKLASTLASMAKSGASVTILADPTLTGPSWKKELEKQSTNLSFSFASRLTVDQKWEHIAEQIFKKKDLSSQSMTLNKNAMTKLNVQKIMHPKITLICPKEDNSFTLIMGTMNYQDIGATESIFIIKGTRDEQFYKNISSAIGNYQTKKWEAGSIHSGSDGIISHGNRSETTYFLPHNNFFSEQEGVAHGQLIELIEGAKKSILLAPQELDDPYIIALLKKKQKGGVKVLIRLQSYRVYQPYNETILSSDNKPIGIAQIYGDLAPCIEPTNSNVRAMVIDDEVAFLGSCKFWYHELRHFTQQVTLTRNKEFAHALAQHIRTNEIPSKHTADHSLAAIKTPQPALMAPHAPSPKRETIIATQKSTAESSDEEESISLPHYTPAMLVLAASLAARIIAHKRFIKRKKHRKWMRRAAYGGMLASLARLGYVAHARSSS